MRPKCESKIAGALRILLVALMVILQVLLVLLLVELLKDNAVYIYVLLSLIAAVDIIFLSSYQKSTSYTIAWLIVILVIPFLGNVLYLLWGRTGFRGKKMLMIKESIERGSSFLKDDPAVTAAFEAEHPERRILSGYLRNNGFPLYKNTSCEYFRLGEHQFEAMLRDMEQAKKFIFIEYFILAAGKLWDRFLDVLSRKSAEGVEVRLLFDDMGSIITAPRNIVNSLKELGIKVRRFSPVHKYINRLYINYRNHQKIVVIDGNIGYTGGANLADEYANLYEKHGHWKDTAIRLEGDAVWGLTTTFLQMWDSEIAQKSDYDAYRPTKKCDSEGYFQPFFDGPISNPDNFAESMYRTVIANARKYVYISSPYLVVDESMINVLSTAAKGGVDVRIITPKVYDHWFVHAVTQSNYGKLLQSGVRIYEYTPGYIHAKTIISDDDHCITGTINMDYRSFYLHFENAVWICGSPVLSDIKADFIDTFAVSEEMSLENWLSRPFSRKFTGAILRTFAILF